jgi:tetratricopeptide (TPR) repeat protein
MGIVYRARQVGLGRTVALKMILHAEHTGADARRRFQREAEAIARLQHPNIVQIHEVGEAGSLPYFSLEYCSGGSLEKKLDGAPWDPKAAGRLVETLTRAVAAAHAAGIVHRDLKPGNVLLTEDGTPKVTDFGLAKRLDATVRTATGAVLGTPSYMAPEQAGGKGKEVGPAADVYALGAILYELLTGRPPFRAATDLDTLFQVLTEEPVPVRRLQPQVPRDLETICHQCLAKDPSRRYVEAKALAVDLHHFVAGEPVAARPVRATERLWRWARRKPAQAGLVAMVLLAFLASVVGVSLFAWQAGQGRLRAEAFAREESKRLDQIMKANDILSSVFRDLNPEEEDPEGQPLRAQLGERLDRAAQLLQSDAVGDPLAVARLQNTLGETQRHLGYPKRAIELHAQARQAFEAGLGPDHREALANLENLAGAYRDAGQMDEAVSLFQQAVQRYTATFGPDDRGTLGSRNNLATAYWAAGKLDEAEPLLEQTLDKTRAKFGPDDADTLECMANLAGVYWDGGKLDKALPLSEQALQRCKARLGPVHPRTLRCMELLALVIQATGQFDKAVPLFEQILEKRKAKLGPDNPGTLKSMNNLAGAYQDTGQLDRAVPLFEQVLEKLQAKGGPDDPSTLGGMNNLATAYRAAGRLDKAVPLFEQTWAKAQAILGPEHPHTLISMGNLAWAYQLAGQLAKALPLFEQALEKMKVKLGPDHPRTLATMGRLAAAWQEGQRHDRALSLWRDLLAIQTRQLAAGHPDRAATQAGLGRCLLQSGGAVEAEPLLRECLLVRQKQQADAWETYHTQSLLGGSLLGQKKYAAAEPLLLAGYEGMKQRQAKIYFPDQVYMAEGVERLVALYQAWGKKEEADRWRRKSAAAKVGAARY